jgi:hypothetical protein
MAFFFEPTTPAFGRAHPAIVIAGLDPAIHPSGNAFNEV